MRLEIVEEKDSEQIVRLKLSQKNDGIDVEVCDRHGNRFSQGSLLCIKQDGTIRRCTGVDHTFGFQLDNCGRVKEHDASDC